MGSSVNQSNPRDLQQLKQMLDNYDKFAARLDDPELPHAERQIIKAALVMLKQFMVAKTRDVERS